MSHQEKQEIFDEYFKSINRVNVDCFLSSFGVHDMLRLNLIKHIFAACDLVQEEQQKRIADSITMKYHDGSTKKDSFIEYCQIGADNLTVDKKSITNPENLIK